MIEMSCRLSTIIDWKEYVGEKEILELSGMGIDDEQVKELSKVLKNNQTVRYIDLSNNKITLDGVESIAEALRVNKAFLSRPLWDTHRLNLYGNPIGKQGCITLIQSLYDTGRYLHYVYLGKNGLTAQEQSELNQNKTVQMLSGKTKEYRTVQSSYWHWK